MNAQHLSTLKIAALALAIGTVAPLFNAGDAEAIPAFTRQHKTECATCHTIFPELTEQGENFYKNSFVWEMGEGKKLTKAQQDAKEKELKDKEYLILSSLPEIVPVSFGGTFNLSYNDQGPSDEKLDLSTRAVKLWAGGALGDKLGFYLDYNLYTEGYYDPRYGNVPSNNVPDLRELFVQARHVFGTPINVKVGRMRPDISLWKGFNKTSVSPFATTGYRVVDSQYYVDASIDGVEANAVLGGRLFVVAGAGKREDQDAVEPFFAVHYKFGGADFEGREQPVNLDSESIFDYLITTLGAYTYYGKEKSVTDIENRFYRYGFEADVRYQRFHAKLASVFGKDKNPSFSASSEQEDSMVLAAISKTRSMRIDRSSWSCG